MTVGQALQSLRELASRIRNLRGTRGEESLYGPFGNFLNDAAHAAGEPDVLAVHQVGAGRGVPDYGVYRDDALVGWVELKAPDKDLDNLRGQDLRQHQRALEDLEWFVLSNGWDFRLFREGQLAGRANVPSDYFRRSGPIPPRDVQAVEALLDRFFSRSALPVATVDEAIQLLARRARAVRRAVLEEFARGATPLLDGVFEEFEGLVYASGRPYRRDDFADAYAQTAVFGLLLARLEAGPDLTVASAADAIDRAHHPFLWRCLHILTDDALPAGLRTILAEAVAAVNRIPPAIFRPRRGVDPLLYAYESFFAAYDPTERAARGVFYTPPSVVGHQVAGIRALLSGAFGIEGLANQGVRYLDPATGTGTYLLGLLLGAHDEIEAAGDPVDVVLAAMVRDRIRAFELMVGPYTVAHQRVSAFLSERKVPVPGRLPIYLVDTLAEALAGHIASRFGPLGAELAEERQAAEDVKVREPILVVVGNPPYDRIHRDQMGDHWLLDRINEAVERTPQEDRVNLKALYDFYVAFWRWALWLVGERIIPDHPLGGGRGIVTYITNRSWIVGRAFGGLRSLFTEACRELWLVDLGADLRSSRTRLEDENVFDVKVGVAIVFAVVDQDSDEPARVMYRRIWGRRADKEAELRAPFRIADFREVDRVGPTSPLLPVEWSELEDAPGIERVFLQHESGIQTSRDKLIVGLAPRDLVRAAGRGLAGSVGELAGLPRAQRNDRFHPTRTHREAPRERPSEDFIRPYAYRPLDRRFLYNDPRYVEWPRPRLQAAFAAENVALVTIERGFGPGPAAFPVAEIPDLHAFRGFGGARGVYPLWRHAGGNGPQGALDLGVEREPLLAPAVLDWARGLSADASPEGVFLYVSALLGAPSYTVRFEGGLVAERPRVPLTSDVGLFERGVELGKRWVDAWTGRAKAPAAIRWIPGGHAEPELGHAAWEDPDHLHIGGHTLAGVMADIWAFEVSGYDVLSRYCRDRRGLPVDEAVLRELRAVAGSVALIVEMGPSLDELLEDVLAGPLVALGP